MTARPCVLLAEDDPADRYLMERAFTRAGVNASLETVADGLELLERLRGEGAYEGHEGRHPQLVLLDLNMPRVDGFSALEQMKADESLRTIPVVVLSTSSIPDHVRGSYARGAAAYISKPGTFDSLIEILQRTSAFWFATALLPPA